jgi:hypothetical protein
MSEANLDNPLLKVTEYSNLSSLILGASMLQKLGFLSILAIGLVLVFPSGDADDVAKMAAGAMPAIEATGSGYADDDEDLVKPSSQDGLSDDQDEDDFVMGAPVTYREDNDGEGDSSFISSPAASEPAKAAGGPKNSASKAKSRSGKYKNRIGPKDRRPPPPV